MMKNLEPMLQLFAEEAAGDRAQFTGETEAAAAPQATGEALAPAAGVQPDRDQAFEALIKGEFKDQYDARVRDTVQKRLRSQKEQTQKLEALTPALNKLAESRGIDPEDITALTKALESIGESAPQTPEDFTQALAVATAQLEKALTSKLAAAQNRPAENGIGAGSTALIRNDVSQMTRQDRADIIRRVRKGETIRF